MLNEIFSAMKVWIVVGSAFCGLQTQAVIGI